MAPMGSASAIAGRVGEKYFSSLVTAILSDSFRGFQPRTLSYFLLVQKVTNTHPGHLNTHRGGTLSMESLPYEPHPRDDTKGDVCPPFGIPPALPKVRCETKT